MGEYDRIQKKLEGRALANDQARNKQFKKESKVITRNRIPSLIQCALYRAGTIMKPSQADIGPSAPLEKMGLSTFSRFKSLPANLRTSGAHISRINTIPEGLTRLKADGNHVSIVPNADVASAKDIANWTLTQQWINGEKDNEYTNQLTANSTLLTVGDDGNLP